MSAKAEQPALPPWDDNKMILRNEYRFLLENDFYAKALEGCPDGELEERHRRAVIDLLHCGHIPSTYMLKTITSELEQAWWPTEYARMLRETQVDRDREMIDDMARVFADKGARNPRTKAKEAVARMQGITVDTLHKRRTRHNQRRRDQT